MAMAFDRYVAICNPFRNTTILTNSGIIQMGFLVNMHAVVLIVPLLLLLKPVFFCRVITLSHFYCYHPDVIKLACSDTRANSKCGLVDLLLTTGVDNPCTVLSYILIIRSVLTITSSGERYKVFSTCVSHIGAVAILYIPMFSLTLTHSYGQSAPKIVHSMMANVCLILPPVLNPIIYSLKAKQIQRLSLVCSLQTKQILLLTSEKPGVVFLLQKQLWLENPH